MKAIKVMKQDALKMAVNASELARSLGVTRQYISNSSDILAESLAWRVVYVYPSVKHEVYLTKPSS